MKERTYITISEMKEIQLGILKEIASFCDQNHLKYFLGFGTLIGAIRHHGYIPWDDDIDIMMPRPDYEFLMQNFNKTSSCIKVVCSSNNKEYNQPLGKAYDDRTVFHETQFKKNVYGVYIDIFPIDGFEKEKYFSDVIWLKKYVHTKEAVFYSNRSFLKKMLIALGKLVLLPIPTHFLLRKIDEIAMKVDYRDATKVTCFCECNTSKVVMDKESLDNLIDWPFEQYQFKVPVGYDEYLRKLFGDYMQLPPVEKRIGHHVYKAWWKELKEN